MKDFGAKTVVFPPKLYIIVAGWHTVFRYQLLMHIIWSIFDQNNAYRTQILHPYLMTSFGFKGDF